MAKIKRIRMEVKLATLSDDLTEVVMSVERVGREILHVHRVIHEDDFIPLFDRLTERMVLDLKKYILEEKEE